MEGKDYDGLTGAEVKARIDKGQVNTSDSHISKTTAEIVRCHRRESAGTEGLKIFRLKSWSWMILFP